MTLKNEKSKPCPVCRKSISEDSKFLPFCSKRCQVIDLGRWASGDYHIKGEPGEPWELSGDGEETIQ
jgi:uncharacterized protein